MPATVEEIYQTLIAPFPPDRVKWRVGRAFWPKNGPAPTKGATCTGYVLAYIDVRDRDERLDQAFGPDGWQESISVVNGGFIATLEVKYNKEGEYGQWIRRSDGAAATDFEPFKGGISDAKKRAAVSLGIARYLYDLGDTKAELYFDGHGWQIQDNEWPRLAKLLGGEVKPEAKAAELTHEQKVVVAHEETEKFLVARRAEITSKLMKTKTKDVIAKIVTSVQEQLGAKWDDLDFYGKCKYIILMEARLD